MTLVNFKYRDISLSAAMYVEQPKGYSYSEVWNLQQVVALSDERPEPNCFLSYYH